MLILVNLLIPTHNILAKEQAQENNPAQKAKILLEKLTPEERVGQLFLIPFKGKDVGEKTQIFELISKHSIGGLVLSTANDNFNGPENLVYETQGMINSLQTTRWNNSIQAGLQGASVPNYIPMFIGVSQEGDIYPNDQLFSGLTQLPGEMAIGATWDPSFAMDVGKVMGKELSAMGFNLYLGPSLDVMDILQIEGDDLGARIFGGNPFWVGEMGKAYIQGLHEGSNRKMAVIAKNFPGRGAANRSPEEEIATVRKPIEQLKQVDLAPFFAASESQSNPDMTTDGFLSSHIRYQGFQGNIRETTKPISLDTAAMEQLMGLPQLSGWRENGGILISDDLSSQAIKRFYDPLGTNYDARQVSRDAFLSGNDLIYLGNFISTGDADKFTTILRTLDFFAQKYREDPAFANKVDISVLRLLTLKYKMYQEFNRSTVLTESSNLKDIGVSQDIVLRVAQKSASLISPSSADLGSSLPHPPDKSEKIAFFTDTLIGHQCSQCPEQAGLSTDALQNAVLKFYGPNASGQVFPYRMVSFSFQELTRYLNNEKDVGIVEENLQSSDWIVFSILNLQSNRPESYALKRLLAERPEVLRNKKVIVFSFNAPYYLDATDISKVTAFYCLYSKTSPFIDLAARILFQEFVPNSSPPISVPGVGYDLYFMVSPDPGQIIPIFVDTDALYSKKGVTPEPYSTTITVVPTPVPRFKVGDTLPLVTGVIYDRNRNTVPDGTVVRFLFTTGGEGGMVQQIETTTMKGVARSSYRIANSGLLEIRVVSDEALASQILQLDINPGESAAITAIAPTSIVITATPEPSHTPPPKTPVVTPTSSTNTKQPPDIVDWLLSMAIIWGSGLVIYILIRRRISIRWGVRIGLTSIIGGNLFYMLLSSGHPFGKTLIANGGREMIYLFEIFGLLVGWGGGMIWENSKK